MLGINSPQILAVIAKIGILPRGRLKKCKTSERPVSKQPLVHEMSTATSIADALARDGIYCMQDVEVGSCISKMDRDGSQFLSKLEPGWEFCKRNVLNNEVGLIHCRYIYLLMDLDYPGCSRAISIQPPRFLSENRPGCRSYLPTEAGRRSP